MPHSGPDWGVSTIDSTIYSLKDMGELAARLKSVDTFDRRGNVLFLDDFEDGIQNWEPNIPVAGGAVEWSAKHSRNHGFSAKLSTTDTRNENVGMTRYQPYPVLNAFGLEIHFTISAFLKYFYLKLLLYDKTWEHYAEIWYDSNNSKLYYATPLPAGWILIESPIYLHNSPYLFHAWKLVVDLKLGEYVRLISNDRSWDLSGIAYTKTADARSPYMAMQVRQTTDSNNVSTIYFDDAIITQNEE